MPSRALSISLLTLASLLATGCCYPQLSGRYRNPCCQTQILADANANADAEAEACADLGYSRCSRRGPFHGCFLSKWLGGFTGDGVPSQQAPEYVSPQPKFHPIPTRPAFEPQLAYLPPELIVPSDGNANPLRSMHGSVHGPLHRGSLRSLPPEPR